MGNGRLMKSGSECEMYNILFFILSPWELEKLEFFAVWMGESMGFLSLRMR